MTKAKASQSFEYAPATVYLGTLGGVATPLIPKGTPLPTKRQDTFSTADAGQKVVEVSVYFGDAPVTASNAEIGSVRFTGIPEAPAGAPQIVIRYELSRTGELKVTATCNGEPLATDNPVLRLSKHWTREAVDELTKLATANRPRDERRASLADASNRARAVIRQAEDRIASGVTGSDRLVGLVAKLGAALEAGDLEAIQSNTAALNERLSPSSMDWASVLFADPFRFGTQKTQASTGGSTAQPAAKKKVGRKPSSGTIGAAAGGAVTKLGKIFGGGHFTSEPNLCFVLMPFSQGLEAVYEDHIKPVAKACGMVCQRADEIAATDLITRQVWEKINRARFLIADLTGRNPNVFYEVGLAHALGKDVILLTQAVADVPFDLRAIRCIEYAYTPRGSADLEQRLTAAIKAIVQAKSTV